MFWKPGAAVSLDVEYKEDLLTLRVPLSDAAPRLALHFLFHQGPGDAALLGSVAGILESPPSATASDAYVAAATRFRRE